MNKISIAIPTYNRDEMTIASFADVHDDGRIDEVVIVDDASDVDKFSYLQKLCSYFPKVKLHSNLSNQDCYRNKMIAVSYCKNPFVCLWDSDNIFSKEYIDRLYEVEWRDDTILTPDFAKPHFDFRAFSGITVTKENISNLIDLPMFETMLNAANYFFNKSEWLSVWDNTIDPVTSDSIFQCYNWLKNGNKIFVVPGLEYVHTIHNGSHYQNNVKRTPALFHESILHNLKMLI